MQEAVQIIQWIKKVLHYQVICAFKITGKFQYCFVIDILPSDSKFNTYFLA